MKKIKYILKSISLYPKFFCIYSILTILMLYLNVYIEIKNYKKYGIIVVKNYTAYALKSGGKSEYTYKISGIENNILKIHYLGRSFSKRPFEIGDTLVFRYDFIDTYNIHLLYNKNKYKIQNYFNVLDYLGLAITMLLLLGYYYLPKYWIKIDEKD